MGVRIKDAEIVESVEREMLVPLGNVGNSPYSGSVGQIKDYIDADKATVAYTGSYNDLTNKPNLNNYVTLSTLNTNYYSKTQVNSLIDGVSGVEFRIVESLPEKGDTNIIYLIEHQGNEGDLEWHESLDDPLTGDDMNVYDEYIWLSDGQTFEKIGSTATSFSDYYDKSEIDAMIPTVGNGTITINQGGVQKGTFTLNQSGNTTINLDAGGGGGGSQVQADWAEKDPSEPSFILNKPNIPYVSNVQITLTQGGVTKGSFTLNQGNASTIALDSLSQVQSNWNEVNVSSPAFIQNKPSIPSEVRSLRVVYQDDSEEVIDVYVSR